MKPAHFGMSLFLLAALIACGDAAPPDEEDASAGAPAGPAAAHPADVLAALPPDAQPYGLDVYTAKCLSCHGDLGQGVGSNPALKGLSSTALQQTLLAYRDGSPQGAQADAMVQAMAGMSDADIAAPGNNSISRLKISLSVSPCRATALSAAHLRDLFNLEME